MKAYHFSNKDCKLRYGDSRLMEVGITHTVEGDIELCKHGLHASIHPFDALQYAPGPILWEVELSGTIIKGNDKVVASSRKYLRRIDSTEILHKFARDCALDVVHLWDAPDVVIQYLKTGDESLRIVAGNAAWAVARAATLDAAWAAAGNAAWNAAGNAAWNVARAAARAAQRRRFSRMIREEFNKL